MEGKKDWDWFQRSRRKLVKRFSDNTPFSVSVYRVPPQ